MNNYTFKKGKYGLHQSGVVVEIKHYSTTLKRQELHYMFKGKMGWSYYEDFLGFSNSVDELLVGKKNNYLYYLSLITTWLGVMSMGVGFVSFILMLIFNVGLGKDWFSLQSVVYPITIGMVVFCIGICTFYYSETKQREGR